MKKDRDLLMEARDRLSRAIDGDRDNREAALDDMEFLAGRQWPEAVRSEREAENRPVITINRLPQFVRQVTGDIRKLNPAIRIKPGDNDATKDVAEVIEGLVRQIEADSDASSVYESAAESAAQCGMGFWRVLTEYEDDDTFNQCIKVERIGNPFSVYCDPEAKHPTRKDAGYWFIMQYVPKDDFEAEYPGKSLSDVERSDVTQGGEHWRRGDEVLVAEYMYFAEESVTIGMTMDGRVIENPTKDDQVERRRTVKRKIPMWAKVSGSDVLEGPKRLPGKFLPVVAVVGEEIHVGDEVVRSSVIRYAKDPQRLYNYWKSTHTEQVALQPKAPYLATVKQIAGHEAMWKAANVKNWPVMLYNPDEKAPGAPQRAIPPQPSAGMMTEVMQAADDMKATTGIYDAGLGAQSNEKSGVAIRQRQLEADVSTSIYTDNLAKSIQHSGDIIVSMIPEIYDTNRVVTILGEEGAEKLVPINGENTVMGDDGMIYSVPVNPLDIGKYTVRVSVGPNYSTRRQETAESMMQFVQAFPQAGQVAGDLIAKAMDWPDADKLAERLAKVLPPGMIDQEDMTPEQQQQMQAGMQQQQAAAQMQMQAQQIEQAKAIAEAREAEAQAREAEAKALEAEMKAQEAQLRLQALLQSAAIPPAPGNGAI